MSTRIQLPHQNRGDAKVVKKIQETFKPLSRLIVMPELCPLDRNTLVQIRTMMANILAKYLSEE